MDLKCLLSKYEFEIFDLRIVFNIKIYKFKDISTQFSSWIVALDQIRLSKIRGKFERKDDGVLYIFS
jgi:hypothetical protein